MPSALPKMGGGAMLPRPMLPHRLLRVEAAIHLSNINESHALIDRFDSRAYTQIIAKEASMRFLVALLVFVVAGPTIAGSMLIPLLDPSWGFDAVTYFPYVVGGGFLVALPISYILAGMLMKRIQPPTAN